ncbi:prohibitin family protein [Iningainema tapete]|uniref:Prohibitin family protein n=1 Tax=Iningainema tapete BLCC-T55 TaxID=2748662 RepID=A0A8J6XR65_9CYAN|nr:prohibitin family protein [Iningainema tapete]MBD2775941.1 prohibitin family protein [Iningainema tapete BLCC-T55]
MKKNKAFSNPAKLTALLCLITIFLTPFVIVDAGQRGVLMQFGQVQDNILGEGIHVIIPIVNTVKKLSVRVQNQELSAEASSKDLQDVFTDVALNWHILPQEVNGIYQQIGEEKAVIERIINPAIEEVLKAVMAKYTAVEIITKRGEVKAEVDEALTQRLVNYHIAVDDISLVHVHFSQRFSDAVEAKQVAEQEAKRAEFIAVRAAKEAQANVNIAQGEAEAQRLLKENLTPDLLKRQAIEKWNGKLPLIVGNGEPKFFDLNELIKVYESK